MCFADTKNWIKNLNRIENFIVSPPIRFPFSNILFSSIHCDFRFSYSLAHSFAQICSIETSLFHFIHAPVPNLCTLLRHTKMAEKLVQV